jgi:hypothetical protein
MSPAPLQTYRPSPSLVSPSPIWFPLLSRPRLGKRGGGERSRPWGNDVGGGKKRTGMVRGKGSLSPKPQPRPTVLHF